MKAIESTQRSRRSNSDEPTARLALPRERLRLSASASLTRSANASAPCTRRWTALMASNAELYDLTAKLVEKAKFPKDEAFARRVLNQFLDRCETLRVPLPYSKVAIQMYGAIAGLYVAEAFDRLPPNPRSFTALMATTKAWAHCVTSSFASQRKAAQPERTITVLSNCIIDSLLAITRHLPPLARDHSEDDDANEGMTIALIDLLPNVGPIIEDALAPFESPEARDLQLFHWLKNLLAENVERQIAQSRNARAVPPSKADGTASAIVSAYLDSTPLERISYRGARSIRHTARDTLLGPLDHCAARSWQNHIASHAGRRRFGEGCCHCPHG